MGRGTYNPWMGERLGAAWRAALDAFTRRDEHTFKYLRKVMMEAGQIQSATVSTILREAKRSGAVRIRGKYDMKTHTDKRWVRLGVPDQENNFWFGEVGAAPSGALRQRADTKLGHRSGTMEGTAEREEDQQTPPSGDPLVCRSSSVSCSERAEFVVKCPDGRSRRLCIEHVPDGGELLMSINEEGKLEYL